MDHDNGDNVSVAVATAAGEIDLARISQLYRCYYFDLLVVCYMYQRSLEKPYRVKQ